jgi:hypothetical protein
LQSPDTCTSSDFGGTIVSIVLVRLATGGTTYCRVHVLVPVLEPQQACHLAPGGKGRERSPNGLLAFLLCGLGRHGINGILKPTKSTLLGL